MGAPGHARPSDRRRAADPRAVPRGPAPDRQSAAPSTASMIHEDPWVLQRTVGNHAVSQLIVQRRTAEEIKAARMDWGGLNLNEEGLASDLVPLLRSGQHGLVKAVFELLAPS